MRHLLPLLLLPLFLFSCGDDESTPAGAAAESPAPAPSGLLPVIHWSEASARFRIETGETLSLVPDCDNLDETTTYEWRMNGAVVSTADFYSFTSDIAGDYFVTFSVTNRHGKTTDEAKITVTEREVAVFPEIPERAPLDWRFPWTSLALAQGRSVKVKAYMIAHPEACQFTWTLDGTPATGLADEPAFIFHASEPGEHLLTLTLTSGSTTQSQDFHLTVCPPPGTYRRTQSGEAMVNRIYAFRPAPGHQVNGFIIVGDSYPEGCTHDEACDIVLQHFQKRWSVSLGAQGGYLVAGFDHSVASSCGGYDLCIKGNPYDYQSEPGIVWVSQDDNGDGLPNDQWFELAGSEYGTERSTQEYAITYYRPASKKSAIGWRDCLGTTGYVPYMSYWNPHDFYWQDWMEGSECTFFGTRLADRSTYVNGISSIPPYDWGYADNQGSDLLDDGLGAMNHFRISDARTWDGQPADLQYIDFVKVQTAQTGSTPNLGEISTELYYIGAMP